MQTILFYLFWWVGANTAEFRLCHWQGDISRHDIHRQAILVRISDQIIMQSAGVTGTLTWTPATSGKTVTIPNATGTVALLQVANIFAELEPSI